MERLLAHPPSLPLVHVDHSHRAAPARTGKCHRVTNPRRVLAEYIVVTKALEKGQPDHVAHFPYFLDDGKCGSVQPKVTLEETKRATENVRLMTEYAAKHCQGDASAMLVNPKTGGTAFVVWVSKDGKTQWAAGDVKEDIEDHMLHFLTDNYLVEDGPKFIITHYDSPYQWF